MGSEMCIRDRTGVKYVPNLFCKLFSITKSLEKGLNIGNDGKQIYLKTNNFKLTFDQVFNTATGYILGIKMVQQARDISQLNLESGKAININRYHELLGHVGIEALKNTANKMDLKLTGKFIKCEDCALSKVRQKNLNKDLVPRATKKGERFLWIYHQLNMKVWEKQNSGCFLLMMQLIIVSASS